MKKIFALVAALICSFNLAVAQDSIQVRITADYTNANNTTNLITGLKHARIMNMLNYRIINTESNQWKLGGNSGSNSFWLGTNNNFPLIFRTNNTERGRFSNGGLFGLGTASPAYLLDVDARGLGGNPLRLQGLQAGTASTDSLLVISNGVVRRVNPASSLFAGSYWGLSANTLSGEASFGSLNNHNILFKQNNIERMRLNAFGVNIGAASSLGNSFTDDVPSLSVYPSFNNSAVSELLVNSPTKSQIVLETQNTNEALKLGIMDGAPYISSNETISQSATEFNGAVYLQPSVTANRMLFVDAQKEIRNTDFAQSQIVLLGGNAVSSVQNIGTTTNFALPFVTNNVERMRITDGGNIGIGTNNPTTALQVNGIITLAASGDRQLQFSKLGSNVFSLEQGGTGIYFYNVTGNSIPFFINNNSNIGFGTTTPANKVHIVGSNPLRLDGLQAGATTDSLLTSQSGVLKRLAISQLGTGNFWKIGGNTEGGVRNFGTTDNFALPLLTNNVERMRITETGSVGIGTNSPNSSAILDLTSTNRGFLLPRLTTAQINAISSPSVGLLIYDNSIPCLKIYTPTGWEVLGTSFIDGVVTTTTSYTANSSNRNVFCNNESSDIVVTLPPASITPIGFEITISRGNSTSSGAVSIQSSSPSTFLIQTLGKIMSNATNLTGVGGYGQSQTFVLSTSGWLNKS